MSSVHSVSTPGNRTMIASPESLSGDAEFRRLSNPSLNTSEASGQGNSAAMTGGNHHAPSAGSSPTSLSSQPGAADNVSLSDIYNYYSRPLSPTSRPEASSEHDPSQHASLLDVPAHQAPPENPPAAETPAQIGMPQAPVLLPPQNVHEGSATPQDGHGSAAPGHHAASGSTDLEAQTSPQTQSWVQRHPTAAWGIGAGLTGIAATGSIGGFILSAKRA